MNFRRRLLTVATLCLATLITPSVSQAAIWTIQPDGTGDFPTIQAAVDASGNGDIVELASGTFSGPGNVDVFVPWPAFTIQSVTGNPADVTIECDGSQIFPHRGFHFVGSTGVLLQGITITGGYGSRSTPSIPSAGAVLLNGAAVFFRDCVFVDNHVEMTWDHAAGAVYVDYGSSAHFEDCEFRGNSAYFGGAVGVNHGSQAEFSDCRFLDNAGGRGGAIWGNATSKTGCLFARNTADQGGAIWSNAYNEDLSVSCTYAENSAPDGGSFYVTTGYGSPVTLIDTIVANSPVGAGIWAASGVTISLSCSDLYGNAGGDWIGIFAPQVDQNGNFSANPCFCSPETDDFQLSADSFCLPGHHPWGCDQLVGAYGEGCGASDCTGPVSIEATTWGSVKGMYR